MLHCIKSGGQALSTHVRPPMHWWWTQKKAQPVEVALKVPPKEEVLEECVSARWATTHQNYAKNLNLMQALSAAMHHIVDVTK
jgi:hypothetical protein